MNRHGQEQAGPRRTAVGNRDIPHGPISDAQRYEWIRSHRSDFAIARALECSDFDDEFDRQIDAAIWSSRMGRAHPLETAWWEQEAHPARRREDD